MATVRFFSEKTTFRLPHPRKTSQWIKKTISAENHTLHNLNFIFCSDSHLAKMNVVYLKHKTLTDIITFDMSQSDGFIEGDIYISIPRVRDNARKFNTEFDSELHRVMIHGVLHLMGYSDKSPSQKIEMREKENAYLSLRQ